MLDDSRSCCYQLTQFPHLEISHSARDARTESMSPTLSLSWLAGEERRTWTGEDEVGRGESIDPGHERERVAGVAGESREG